MTTDLSVVHGQSGVAAQGVASCVLREDPSTALGRDVATWDGEIGLRDYQWPVFLDHATGILVLHWARQIGKSFVLAAWAVSRLIDRPGRLVTVLSNSRENGAEFVEKCAEICRRTLTPFELEDNSPSLDFAEMRLELRIRLEGNRGRIKVLAANPRTARGFSGVLILDEFAFHEDAEAIWAAAEPILASNADFLCRVASTGNGRHNLFYRMVADPIDPTDSETTTDEARELTTDGTGWTQIEGGEVGHKERIEHKESDAVGEAPTATPEAGVLPITNFKSREGFWVTRISRTRASGMGVKIYDAQTRRPITPEAARAQALDKRSYDQNYECAFADENLSLLSHELISAAEDDEAGIICERDWSQAALAMLTEAKNDLYVGFDVGRKVDLSVITVLEKVCSRYYVRGILRIQDMRLPDQELRLGEICRLPKFRAAAIDMTGLGLGLYEYARKSFGSRIRGINFASTVPVTKAIEQDGGKRETVRVTETMAMELLRCYEDRRMRHPRDGRLRDDLRKPEKVTSPGGRVSISATRDQAGHADHFWSLALAVEAAGKAPVPFAYRTIMPRRVGKYLL